MAQLENFPCKNTPTDSITCDEIDATVKPPPEMKSNVTDDDADDGGDDVMFEPKIGLPKVKE